LNSKGWQAFSFDFSVRDRMSAGRRWSKAQPAEKRQMQQILQKIKFFDKNPKGLETSADNSNNGGLQPVSKQTKPA